MSPLQRASKRAESERASKRRASERAEKPAPVCRCVLRMRASERASGETGNRHHTTAAAGFVATTQAETGKNPALVRSPALLAAVFSRLAVLMSVKNLIRPQDQTSFCQIEAKGKKLRPIKDGPYNAAAPKGPALCFLNYGTPISH